MRRIVPANGYNGAMDPWKRYRLFALIAVMLAFVGAGVVAACLPPGPKSASYSLQTDYPTSAATWERREGRWSRIRSRDPIHDLHLEMLYGNGRPPLKF